jgi:uncharacterized protein (DUF849 family)
MMPTSALTPHAPLTCARIVEEVLRCAPAGASMFHLHVREDDESPSCSAARYAQVIDAIRESLPEAVLVASTSGRTHGAFEQRSEVLNLPPESRPDMASLTLGSMNFRYQTSHNSPQMVERLAARMAEQQVKPELEVFELGMMNVAHWLIGRGLLQPPYYFNILLGNFQGAQARASHLGAIVAELPAESLWAVGGVGRFQTRAALYGIAEGYGVRTGLEDNLWLDDERARLATNLEMVSRVKTLAEAVGRPLSSLAHTRAALGLSPLSRP